MIFLLHGSESFRRQKKLQELKNKYIDKLDPLGQSLSILDGAKLSAKNLSDSLSSGSLFTKKRMVVIENIFENKQESLFSILVELIKKNEGDDDNIIIFNEDLIKKTALQAGAKKLLNYLLKQPYVQEFKNLNNFQLSLFVKEIINEKKAKINNSALNLLILKIGNNLYRLNNETNKLIAAANGQEISNILVEELIKGETEENIFALTDALGAKNKALALRLLEEQLDAGLSLQYILAMLQRQIRIILSIKYLKSGNNLSDNQIVHSLKLHPFVIKKALQQSNNFSLTELKNYWQNLLDIDLDNKKGKSDIKSELYALLVS
ncbi:MAG: DNA polymerase III subunit delta [Clostridia bacterium]|nr:DNA polymerase III subunit delta [Clostridia bacterium]